VTNLLSSLKIGKRLGSGSFGTVYLGEDEAHGTVAVKKLARKSHWPDPVWDAWRARYLAEAKSLSKAADDHVVKVHHVVGSDDGETVYICMAFCPGGSLQSAFENGPLPLPAVRNFGTDVLMGLAALHARGMLHRDIKPANILLDAQNRALIGDFGLVTDDIVFGYASDAGYYDHWAYEVWHGKGTSERTDIWAVGATLYRLLHAQLWYEESPDPKGLVKHGGFADGLKWLPHIPRKWRRVIRQMMEDNSKKRYQTANQALSALSRLPISPAWETTVGSDMVRWTMISGNRLRVVEWKRVPRHHEWMAWSEPLGKGQKKKLGGSGGTVSASKAASQLEKFLGA
jgi:serine/threonine-protein kinase